MGVINDMEDLFKTVMMILVSGSLGYLVGNSLRYSNVVSDQKLMKQRMAEIEKELILIKAGEQKIFDELKKFREDMMDTLNDIRLDMKDKVDRSN